LAGSELLKVVEVCLLVLSKVEGVEVEGLLDRTGDGDMGDDEEDFQEAKELLRDGC
jgi:hypothetical protein